MLLKMNDGDVQRRTKGQGRGKRKNRLDVFCRKHKHYFESICLKFKHIVVRCALWRKRDVLISEISSVNLIN